MIQLRRILLPTDFSDAAAKAIPYAVSLAREYGAEVHLLHVVEDSVYYAQFVYDGAPFDAATILKDLTTYRQKELQKLADSMLQDKSVKIHIRHGIAATQIVQAAGELDVDTVVISSHGRTGLSHLVFGSVAERVVRECPCPVLTIREKAHGMLKNGS